MTETRVQAERKDNHQSRRRCQVYSSGRRIRVHAPIVRDARRIPTVGIRIQAKRNSNNNRRKYKRYSNEEDPIPSKAAETIIDVSAGRDIGVLHKESLRETRLSELGATKNRGVVRGVPTTVPPLLVCSYTVQLQLSEITHRKGGPGRDYPAASKSTRFNHGSRELYRILII